MGAGWAQGGFGHLCHRWSLLQALCEEIRGQLGELDGALERGQRVLELVTGEWQRLGVVATGTWDGMSTGSSSPGLQGDPWALGVLGARCEGAESSPRDAEGPGQSLRVRAMVGQGSEAVRCSWRGGSCWQWGERPEVGLGAQERGEERGKVGAE